jgi:aspartyl/asparaginyl beta-hydroxylase (cupin superfamily)
MNWMLTLHTALQGPKEDGCGITGNGIRKDWMVGDPAVMDATYCHSTYSESDEDLYLFIVDFWHPDLSIDETDGLPVRRFFAMNSGV